MLKNKFKIYDIMKATGLSKEEILKLKEEKWNAPFRVDIIKKDF